MGNRKQGGKTKVIGSYLAYSLSYTGVHSPQRCTPSTAGVCRSSEVPSLPPTAETDHCGQNLPGWRYQYNPHLTLERAVLLWPSPPRGLKPGEGSLKGTPYSISPAALSLELSVPPCAACFHISFLAILSLAEDSCPFNPISCPTNFFSLSFLSCSLSPSPIVLPRSSLPFHLHAFYWLIPLDG